MWLKEARRFTREMPPEAYGHFFGSAARRPGGPGMTTFDFERSCVQKPLARVRDGLVLQPPFRVPAGSPFPRSVLLLVAEHFPML
eukprot:11234176-Alexandrium_andersonii.AAC.1